MLQKMNEYFKHMWCYQTVATVMNAIGSKVQYAH